MKIKKEISFLTFGIFLILIGFVLKLTNNTQADLVIGIGLVFELMAAMIFAWNKIRKKK